MSLSWIQTGNMDRLYGLPDVQWSVRPEVYAAQHSLRVHPLVRELAEVTMKHEMARYIGSFDESQLLQNLVRLIGAKKTLEIGVFTGISALSIALVLPEDGKVYALDVSREFVEVGMPYWKKAGVDKKIEFIEGLAAHSLDKLIAEGHAGTFDYAFIDADKPDIDNYYEKCLKLVRSGGIIAIDDTLWFGRVFDIYLNSDEASKAMRALNEKLHHDERVHISFLTIGDGTTLLFKK